MRGFNILLLEEQQVEEWGNFEKLEQLLADQEREGLVLFPKIAHAALIFAVLYKMGTSGRRTWRFKKTAFVTRL